MRGKHEHRPVGRVDLAIAAALAAGAAITYSLTFHPDWIYDPLRYAELMQRGPVSILLGPQHALGNLLPLLVYRAARGVGYGGHAMPVLAGFSVAGAATAVGAMYVAAVRLGGSRLAGATAAAALGAAAAPWRAGGSGGVYGVALGTLAIAWLVAARFVRAPSARSAAALGAAAGLALGGHLANVAFVAAALGLVLALASKARWRATGAFVGALAVTAGVILVVTAGVATGWSLGGMRHWLLHPGIGGSTDRSSLVGWGIGGLYPAVVSGQPHVSWLPLGLDRANGHLGILVVWALIAVALMRGALLAARSRAGRVLAGALFLNAALAFLLASWYQALRSDYWGLGLVPLAVMAGAGTVTFRRRSVITRAVAGTAALAVVAALLAWNASQDVAPTLQISDARARAVDAIVADVPRDAHVLVSLMLRGRLADLGFRAEGGFEALQSEVRAGAPKPGVAALIHEARRRPVYVSSVAFGLIVGQASFLGATGDEIWRRLHRCCDLRAVLTTSGLPRDETLYRLVPR